MINDILQKDAIKADLGFGVDYYKGEDGKDGMDGKTPVKGVDYFTPEDIEQIENQLATPATKDKIGGIKLGNGNTKTGVKDTFMRKGQQLAVDDNKPDTPYITYASNLIPGVVIVKEGNGLEYNFGSISMSPATTSSLGTVKPDGTTITVDGNGVLTSVGSGSGSSYTLPVASDTILGGIKIGNRNSLTIKDNLGRYGASLHAGIEDADVPIIPYAGNTNPGVVRVSDSGSGLKYSNGVVSMSPASTTTYGTVAYDGKTIQAKLNPSDQPTLYAATATTSSLGVVKPDGTTTTVDANGNLKAKIDNDTIIVKDGSICVDKSQLSASNGLPTGGDYPQILMKNGSSNFDTAWVSMSEILAYAGISIGGSDWQYTQDQSNSDLYNAKELVVYIENSNGFKQMGYFNFGNSNLGNFNNENFHFDYNSSSPYIYYDGSSLGYGNANSLQYICYKT